MVTVPVVFSVPEINRLACGLFRFPGKVSQKSVPLLSSAWPEALPRKAEQQTMSKSIHLMDPLI